MASRRSKRSLTLGERQGPSLALVLTIFLGLLGATLAFSHAAAQTGVALNAFRPLGGSFFAWRSGQVKLAAEAGRGGTRMKKLPLVSSGQQILLNAPLTPRGLWFIGLGRDAHGDHKGARSALTMAERLSRREGSVQLWLAADDLKKMRGESGLRHFDIVLRTTPEAAQEILPRLSMAAMSPDGRAALKPYMRPENPWMSRFLITAAERLPRAAPLGLLLSEPGLRLPDDPISREAYSVLVRRLAAENSYDVFGRVYPVLPRADAKSLQGLGLEFLSTPDRGYAPAVWDFGASSDRGGAPIAVGNDQVGLEFFAAPGTVGAAGSKLIQPGARRTLEWSIEDRVVNNDATARWIATCVGGNGEGAATSSDDMIAKLPTGKRLRFNLPAKCQMVRLDLRFAGGTGRQPASVIVGNLALVGTSSASR